MYSSMCLYIPYIKTSDCRNGQGFESVSSGCGTAKRLLEESVLGHLHQLIAKLTTSSTELKCLDFGTVSHLFSYTFT
ncbi:hypothetical protein L1887_20832 [Cichorium endivia]|nr:hypothetical protein L1887_20832 [Cichorium endivia]